MLRASPIFADGLSEFRRNADLVYSRTGIRRLPPQVGADEPRQWKQGSTLMLNHLEIPYSLFAIAKNLADENFPFGANDCPEHPAYYIAPKEVWMRLGQKLDYAILEYTGSPVAIIDLSDQELSAWSAAYTVSAENKDDDSPPHLFLSDEDYNTLLTFGIGCK